MLSMNITNFRKEIFKALDNTIEHNETININTKNGNVVVISEADYKDMMETINICSIPSLREKIVEGLNTPASQCIPENKVDW